MNSFDNYFNGVILGISIAISVNASQALMQLVINSGGWSIRDTSCFHHVAIAGLQLCLADISMHWNPLRPP